MTDELNDLPGNARKQKLLGLDLPSNSDTVKHEKTNIERKHKVHVSGRIVKKNRSLGTRFAETFLGGGADNVGEYVIKDVLVPALKSMMSDMVTGGIEMLLFGDRQTRGSSRRNKKVISYTNYFQNNAKREEPRRTRPSRGGRLDDLYVETKRDGDIVLETLDGIMEEFQVVTVADLLDTLELQSDYTDNNYGWTNLAKTSITRTPDGYKINMPRPESLD
jgi:hypothetical protein